MAKRNIIEINEDLCNGCGQCVRACAEGAIQLVNGKAKLVSDVYCDGLGACIGECPTGALKVVQREAAEFDETKVEKHLSNLGRAPLKGHTHGHGHSHDHGHSHGHGHSHSHGQGSPCGCPGSAPRDLRPAGGGCPGSAARTMQPKASAPLSGEPAESQLVNWPVQFHLIHPQAPYFNQSDLLIVADCVPFACPDFHTRILRQNPVIIGCPKLDETGVYIDKLAQILAGAELKSLTVVHMEVPCCSGLLHIAAKARELAGIDMEIRDITIGINGTVLGEDAF